MDLIDRRAAINALGEEPSVWNMGDSYELGKSTQWKIDKLAIEGVPSAQPEIVRCKDCRYNIGLSEFIKDYYCCDYHEHIVSADDFCSNAERREK